ncbi:MAG: PAS domain-containing sensor histidine kinase [Alphaproteobacteria bacterium]|nr:MAG: PAS domain-containing sensor histidine kinase [Alphaproteobacteria bacterium]
MRGKVRDFDVNKLGKILNKTYPWVFLALAGLFLHGLLKAPSCTEGLMPCAQLLNVVMGLIAVQGLYMIRPWLKVREKILSLAVELKILDRIPRFKRNMSLEEAAQGVIVTLSKLQEDARATTEAMLALQQSQTDLMESLPEPVMVLDPELHILRANNSARELFPDLLVSKNLITILRDPQLLETCQRSIASGQEDDIEVHLSVPVERTFQARVKPIQHRGFTLQERKSALLLSLNDITTIKRTEQMRADFVANVSHEMRTPLASVLGFVETLQGPASNDAAAQKNFLKIIETQAKSMSRLVEDLLSLSRIEMREHHQPEDAVEIEPVLNNIAVMLQMQIKQKNMTLQIKTDENLPQVQGDADELFQVISNLVTNAIRYGRPGTPVIVEAGQTTDIPPQFPLSQEKVVFVSVSDRGMGISAQHIPRLTERFYRVDKARSREVGGTGLGLAIVKHILNRHRGCLVVESQENVGSKFTIYLPIYN